MSKQEWILSVRKRVYAIRHDSCWLLITEDTGRRLRLKTIASFSKHTRSIAKLKKRIALIVRRWPHPEMTFSD